MATKTSKGLEKGNNVLRSIMKKKGSQGVVQKGGGGQESERKRKRGAGEKSNNRGHGH